MKITFLRAVGALPLCLFVALLADAHAKSRAWEADNHCKVIGQTDPGPYQTSPVRTRLGCDCGFYWRSTR